MFVIYRFEMDGLIFCYTAIGKYIKERYIDDNIEHKKEIAFVSFREQCKNNVKT